MMLFPVAQRELLAAARRPATFRTRIGTALLASAFAVIMLVYISLSGAGRQAGQFLFSALWFGVLWFAVLAGSFLTADAISEERRDGTLGLMFLTDLNGFEVVAGKFVGAALNAAYGMMAVFPVMATAWFLGGITDGEFWRALIVSLNALFVSLAVGLLVSSCARQQSRAVVITVLIQVFLQLGLRLLVAGTQFVFKTVHLEWMDWISPADAASRAGDTRYVAAPEKFWVSLIVSHAFGWLLLLAAGLIVAQNWRDHATPPPTDSAWRRRLMPFLEGWGRRRWTPARVDRNPLAALFARDRRIEFFAWLVALGGVAGCAILHALHWLVPSNGGNSPTFYGNAYVGVFGTLSVLFKALYGWEATAFFGEARRTGALDLALTAPLTDSEILSAHRRYLSSTLMAPLCVLCLADLATIPALDTPGFLTSVIGSLLGVVGTILQCAAMTSLGAWLSLTEKRPLVAWAKTLAFAALLPALLTSCCVGLLIPPILTAWAQSKLHLPLREVLSGVRSPWQLRPAQLGRMA